MCLPISTELDLIPQFMCVAIPVFSFFYIVNISFLEYTLRNANTLVLTCSVFSTHCILCVTAMCIVHLEHVPSTETTCLYMTDHNVC